MHLPVNSMPDLEKGSFRWMPTTLLDFVSSELLDFWLFTDDNEFVRESDWYDMSEK